MRSVKVILKSKSSFDVYDLQGIFDKDGKDISNDFIGYSQPVTFRGSSAEAIVSGDQIEYVFIQEKK